MPFAVSRYDEREPFDVKSKQYDLLALLISANGDYAPLDAVRLKSLLRDTSDEFPYNGMQRPFRSTFRIPDGRHEWHPKSR